MVYHPPAAGQNSGRQPAQTLTGDVDLQSRRNNQFFRGLRPLTPGLLVLLWCASAWAHFPHDVVDDLQLSPAYAVDQTLYATVRRVLYRSRTGGHSWERLSRGLACTGDFGALGVSPAFARDGTLFVACSGGALLRSTDRGEHHVVYIFRPGHLDVLKMLHVVKERGPGLCFYRFRVAVANVQFLEERAAFIYSAHVVVAQKSGVLVLVHPDVRRFQLFQTGGVLEQLP